jgi:hypothetical protein
MLQRAFELVGFFGTAYVKENVYEIWNMES